LGYIFVSKASIGNIDMAIYVKRSTNRFSLSFLSSSPLFAPFTPFAASLLYRIPNRPALHAFFLGAAGFFLGRTSIIRSGAFSSFEGLKWTLFFL
jgi:hypothetical protein